ncbi:MAG: hypothetical protein L3J83_07455 [Proteobacteria bacterium]|nr:hypothetical protein [Pseudomonadota bacterium]
MFEKLKNKIKELQVRAEKQYENQYENQYEKYQFDDPVAKKTEWQPLKPGGTNFKTSTLIEKSPSVYRYQLSFGGLAFIGIFALIGVVTLLIGVYLFFFKGENAGTFLFICGSIFAAAAYFMFRAMGVPKVFDSNLGIFWVGYKQPSFSGDQSNKQQIIYFSNIYAIQILSERIKSDNGSFRSYEMNLVMKDGSRFNVVDHGNLSQILLDVEIISTMLHVPVWDVNT